MVAYTRIQRVLSKINPVHLTLTDITAMGPSDQEFKILRSGISSPNRFRPTIHNVTLGDAYVYQM